MLCFADIDRSAMARLLADYGIDLRVLADGQDIPGSYHGESEAGLRGNTLLARLDTPVHSILHEAAHYVCMSPERRVGLERDAGGDYAEEDAVCYLQILLAGRVRGFGSEGSWRDMDEWGYTFRLDNAKARAWIGAPS